MPRPLRIEFENAYYHVMNRGANRQKIFISDENRNIFYDILEEIVDQFKVEIHAFCLMSNHYHLLIKTPYANLSCAMRHLDGVYTRRFNKSMNRDGPLFRGRYKAILIESDSYFLQVSRYIHLNPVEAKIYKNPVNYKWSSLRSYLNIKASISWLMTSFTLSQMSGSNKIAAYLAYVQSGVDEETCKFYKKSNIPSIYGTKNFIKSKLDNLDESYISNVLTDFNHIKPLPKADDILKYVNSYFQITSVSLCESKHGKKNLPKMVAIYLLRQLGHLKHKKISTLFPGLKTNSIASIIARFKALIRDDLTIQKHVENIVNAIPDADS